MKSKTWMENGVRIWKSPITDMNAYFNGSADADQTGEEVVDDIIDPASVPYEGEETLSEDMGGSVRYNLGPLDADEDEELINEVDDAIDDALDGEL